MHPLCIVCRAPPVDRPGRTGAGRCTAAGLPNQQYAHELVECDGARSPPASTTVRRTSGQCQDSQSDEGRAGREYLGPAALPAVPVLAYAALAGGIAGFSLRPSIMHATVALAAEGRLEVLADPAHMVKICEECAKVDMDELVKMGKSGRGSERCEGSIDGLVRGAA